MNAQWQYSVRPEVNNWKKIACRFLRKSWKSCFYNVLLPNAALYSDGRRRGSQFPSLKILPIVIFLLCRKDVLGMKRSALLPQRRGKGYCWLHSPTLEESVAVGLRTRNIKLTKWANLWWKTKISYSQVCTQDFWILVKLGQVLIYRVVSRPSPTLRGDQGPSDWSPVPLPLLCAGLVIPIKENVCDIKLDPDCKRLKRFNAHF